MSSRQANVADLIAAIDSARFAEFGELPEITTVMLQEHAAFLDIKSPIFPISLSPADDLALKHKLMELAAGINNATKGLTCSASANAKTAKNLYENFKEAGLFVVLESSPSQNPASRPSRAFPSR